MFIRLLIAGFISLTPYIALASPLEDGIAAYERGDYQRAIELWRPLAVQGDAGAQSSLGVAHYEGRGVPQDFVEAIKWFGRAAEQGYAGASINLGLAYVANIISPPMPLWRNGNSSSRWPNRLSQ